MKAVTLLVLSGILAFTAPCAAAGTYTYDSLNRLTGVDYGNGTTINYTYDAAGNRTASSTSVALSTNANLDDLTISSGTLAPPFAAGTPSYTASVASGINSITVTPMVADSGASVQVNGSPVVSGTPSGAISLDPGSNLITILVTAADTVTEKTYAIDVTRAAPVAPDPPTAVTATPGNAQAGVSFTPPINNGGAPITGYTATCTPTVGPPIAASGPASPIIVPGLTNGVTYLCTVKATNNAGDGPESAPANPVTPSAATPAALSVSLSGSGSGMVASSPPGVACPGDCAESYPAGTGVVLTAAATGGSVFTGWLGGGCTGTSATCNVTINTATTVNATFAAPGTAATLNIDLSNQSTEYDALTDGLLILRYLSGLTGTSLTTGALDGAATLTDPVAVTARLDDIRPALDVDGDGQVNATTDGLLLMRYLFGLRGDALIAGAVAPQASRTTAPTIETYIQTLMP